MIDTPTLSGLHVRSQLEAFLSELRASDPRPLWEEERRRGLASGVDAVFHFFFDDHDFDEQDVGFSLYDSGEVRLIGALKNALNAVLEGAGNADDEAFVSHPGWQQVTQAAAEAAARLRPFPNDR
jgi:hypothetical protein